MNPVCHFVLFFLSFKNLGLVERGIVAQAFNPLWEAEAGGSLVGGHLGLHSKILSQKKKERKILGL